MVLRADLQKLVDYGKKEQEIDILENKVHLRLLDIGENIEVLKEQVGMDVFWREKANKVFTLARATVMINNTAFPTLKEAKEFYNRLQEPVLNLFWEHYMLLRTEQVGVVGKTQLKDDPIEKAIKEQEDGQQKS